MKKVLIKFIVTIIMLFLFSSNVLAKEVNVYVFYGKTCPHCEEAMKYLDKIKNKYDLNIIKYEVWYDSDNQKIMNEVADFLDVNPSGVPFVIIDNTPIFGYSSGVTDDTYKYHIKMAKKNNFKDKVGIKLGIVKGTLNENKKEENNKQEKSYELSIPIIGNINFNKINIYLSSIILGLIEGLNINMLWIFAILLAFLLVIKNNKDKILLSILLLFFLNISYIVFINNGNFDDTISYTPLIRLILSVILICFGTINLYSYANELDDKKSVKENRINKFIKNNKIIILSVIMIIFGILSNFIRISNVNDASILFTDLLKLNGITNKMPIIILYTISSLVMNLIIFELLLLLSKLFNKTKLSKASKLISGILFFIVGISMLVR